MTTPAGWYPDPSPQNTDGAGMRYWDGNAWTEQVSHPGAAPAQPPAPGPGAPQAGYPAYPSYPAYPTQPGGTPYFGPAVPATPDGQPLAGWWMRVLAYILDGIFQLPLIALATAPVVINQWDDIKAWYDRNTTSTSFHFSTTDLPDAFDITTKAGLAFYVSIFVAGALYQLVFLGWKQATPGKLATGLRIRKRETPGLPWSTILLRWGFVTVLGLLGQMPAAGALFGLIMILDWLWPLWDKNKQALHDKVAGTNVVKKA